MYTTKANNPKALIILGVAVVVVILIIVIAAIRRREEVFEGEVIDKNIIEMTNNNMPMNNMNMQNNGGIDIVSSGGVRHQYTIKVKTGSGKTINYNISSGMYEVIKIGDMVSKPKGTTEVTIVSSKKADSDSTS